MRLNCGLRGPKALVRRAIPQARESLAGDDAEWCALPTGWRDRAVAGTRSGKSGGPLGQVKERTRQ